MNNRKLGSHIYRQTHIKLNVIRIALMKFMFFINCKFYSLSITEIHVINGTVAIDYL